MAKITVRIPEDHWVNSLPRGKRSEVIRNILDNTEEIMKSINDLEYRLSQKIDQRLSRLEKILENSASITANKEEQKSETNSKRPEIDIEAFMDI